MKKIISNILITFLTVCFFNFSSLADDTSKQTEINLFTGLFDFSDDKQKAGLFEIGRAHV